MTGEPLYLLLITLIAIFLLLFLVMRLKIHAFISLLMVSAFVGLGAGMGFQEVLDSIQEGMGGILGFIAIIVGLGSIIGKLLEVSGGAEALARNIVQIFGTERTSWGLTITGFIISIPVFLDVGFIILVPIVYALARKSKKSTLFYAIPLLAGLGVTHAFIPPTPGPTAVAEIMDVSLGWVIIFGFAAGVPAAILAGPIFGKYIGNKIDVAPPDFSETSKTKDPSLGDKWDFYIILVVILLPLFLIVNSTIFDVMQSNQTVAEGAFWVNFIQFVGHPFVALIIATLVAAYFLGYQKGFTGKEVLKFSDKALAPAGLIILVTGAGGVFKEILIDSGVGEALAETILAYQVAPIVLAYLLAVIIRVTQGSATVAMITSAGMVAPVVSEFDMTSPEKALIVIAIAAGSTILSHVNDSGFWLVNKYLGLTEKQTLQSWTAMETIISVTGFAMALLLYYTVV
ncbi:Gnt-I system low-affinity gluconate transporter [Fodinibius roseus]|uniref:Gnt-I system low-affinity gluconate transporter n=1 Tax=Fodinibius roseus TaxID=1194090 RepID=A0A1M4TST9_9BACT|nr:gluconate:H+ symporter [Fodinibius roseus]SHE47513.1 Gnt-I system low-affinity gluconate transporter [Fodinibius roseus]